MRPLIVNLLKKNPASLPVVPQAATSPSFSSGVFGKLCLKRRVDPGGGGGGFVIRIHKERRVKKVLG